MKWRPILFSGEMVRAILDGRKTQTRRVMKPQPSAQVFQYCSFNGFYPALSDNEQAPNYNEEHRSPYGVAGDRLWVRENGWERPDRTDKMMREGADTWPPYQYDVDDCDDDQLREWGWKRRPSIFMPRWASRIILEIVKVRVERVQDISEADAQAEGITERTRLPGIEPLYAMTYAKLWNALNAKRGFGWDMNPWVWVIEFKRIK
jgi:hypothetical protein